MIREDGLHCIGFLTLTVGDSSPDGFLQVFDSEEANRRIGNLLRRILPLIFRRCVIVTERHKNKAIHFHIVGSTSKDIRDGFDFDAFLLARDARNRGTIDQESERHYKTAANQELRDLWAFLREHLPSYGFGRAELTPIRVGGEAIASYVAKYVEKNLFNRLAEDKGKKLVRYSGWKKQQMKPNEFSWATPGAASWRLKAQELALLVGITDRDEMQPAFGSRWAFKISRIMGVLEPTHEGGFRWCGNIKFLARQFVSHEYRGQNDPIKNARRDLRRIQWEMDMEKRDAWQPFETGNYLRSAKEDDYEN